MPADRVLDGLAGAGDGAGRGSCSAAEACGIADWAVHTAADYAKIRHQFGRPIGQFQAVKHRCAWMLTAAEQAARRGLGRGPGARRGRRSRRRRASSPRRWPRGRRRRRRQLRARVHPGARRHRLHLGARRPPLLPPRAVAARAARRLRRLGASGSPTSRWPARAGRWRRPARARPSAVRAGAGGAGRDRRPGRPAAPPRWPRAAGSCRTCRGPGAGAPAPLEQLVIAQELEAAGLRRRGLVIGAWVVPALVEYGTPEQQERFLPATLRGETDLVPAVQRARRRLGPGRR